MMLLCESHDCTNWVQWRITGKTENGRDQVMKLCQRHKIEAMANPVLKDQKAIFVGAMPDLAPKGAHHGY